MNKVTILFICILLFATCKNRVKIIPKDDLVHILADMQLADATLDQSDYKKSHHYDTIIYYQYIFDKYGYQKRDFDSTISYYSRDMEKVKEIYEKVMELLQQQRMALTDSNNVELNVSPGENIWNKKSEWKLPNDGGNEKIEFDIPVKGPGKYTFKAEIKLYFDDESQNPRLNIYFYKKDEKNSYGRRKYWRSVFFEKDEIFKPVTVTEELHDTSFTHIKGQILSHTNVFTDGAWKKHAEIKNITLFYEPSK